MASPYHGRDAPGTEGLIGYFVNVLPLRVAAARGGTVGALLRAAREAAAGGVAHAALPFQQLVHEELPLRVHDASRNAVFQAMLAWEEDGGFGAGAEGSSGFGPEVEVEPASWGAAGEAGDGSESGGGSGGSGGGGGGVAKVELTLSAGVGASGGIVGAIEYNRDLFAHESVERLAARLAALAEALAGATDDADAWALPLLPEAEAALVLHGFNDTFAPFPAELCVHDLVAAQAARSPDAVALEWRGDTMSYAELHASASRVAAWLAARGVAPDGVVALQLDRSLEQVVGVYGVLLSGGAYLPLDPKWPLERRRFMVEDAACGWLVAQSAHAAEFAGWFGGAVLALDDARRVPEPAAAAEAGADGLVAAAERVRPHHLAYVIYTSGSTGKPKGVLVEHGGVVNLLHGTTERYPQHEPWVVGLSTAYVFDVFVHVLFNAIGVRSKSA